MRIEILFDGHNKVAQKTIDALYTEIEKRLKPKYPKLSIRIANSTTQMVQVSGAKDADERDVVIGILQEIWDDDNWLPA